MLCAQGDNLVSKLRVVHKNVDGRPFDGAAFQLHNAFALQWQITEPMQLASSFVRTSDSCVILLAAAGSAFCSKARKVAFVFTGPNGNSANAQHTLCCGNCCIVLLRSLCVILLAFILLCDLLVLLCSAMCCMLMVESRRIIMV